VIQEFLASWPLFHHTYLVGWLIGLLLALGGVLVVARDQIFIGAAVS
jgi:ABC-type Mn2+/Zn2+ transport system permease subunit